jgi:Fe-S-cluster containining protein
MSDPDLKTLQFALKVQGAVINVSAQLPDGPVRPAVLLPIIQNLSSSISTLTENEAARVGKPISCREGCGACCRQAVPISPVEARMLSEYIDAQPEGRREVLRARFRAAAVRLEESGIAPAVRAISPSSENEPLLLDKDTAHALGLRYFALGIPCPFLEDDRCTIHPIRPMRCREYMVASPPEHCAHPESKEILGVKPPVLLSRVLSKWNTSGETRSTDFILLTMLDEWIAAHPDSEDRATRTAPELLQEFLRTFASENSSASGPHSTKEMSS